MSAVEVTFTEVTESQPVFLPVEETVTTTQFYGTIVEETTEATTLVNYEESAKESASFEGIWIGVGIGGVFALFAIGLGIFIKMFRL